MNRRRVIAFVLLAAWPTITLGQANPKQVLDAQSRMAPSNSSKRLLGADLSDWSAYNRAGWRAINKGYYETAEHEFLTAIKTAKRPSIDDPRLVARSYADYAWALQKQGRNAQAEPLAKWALVAREASFEPTSTAIAQSLNQLATLYEDLGRFSDAEPLLRRAIDAQAKVPKANPQEHARSQTLMGLLYSAQRRYADAEPYFAKAVSLLEKVPRPMPAEVGDALANLAWTLHDQGKDDEAKPLFERALKAFERFRVETDPSIAHVVNGLGQILAKQGKPTEAEANFLKAIEILERLPAEGLSLLDVLRQYANLLEDLGRPADLAKVKARLAPLRAKYTAADVHYLGPWYRYPEPAPGQDVSPANISG